MKNIYRTACWIACLLCCVHTLCGKNVEGDVNYVLIINTYTESTPWSNSMIYPIVSMASQDEKLGVYTEHMNMLMMDGEEELAAFEKNIFKDFETRPPKLIVLLGQPVLFCVRIWIVSGRISRSYCVESGIMPEIRIWC